MRKLYAAFIFAAALIAVMVLTPAPEALAQAYGNLFFKLYAPITTEVPVVKKTSNSWSTTMVVGVDTDIPQTGAPHNIAASWAVLSYPGNTARVCYDNLDFAAATTGANCGAKCAAAANWPGAALPTCDGSSTDAQWLPPGTSAEVPLDGRQCLCVMAESSGQYVQVRRIYR